MNKMEKWKIIKHKPTGQKFRAVYFDGTDKCFNEIIGLITTYYDGFIEYSNPITIYYQCGKRKHYMVKLYANHWFIPNFSDNILKKTYGISRYISDKKFNKLFEIV